MTQLPPASPLAETSTDTISELFKRFEHDPDAIGDADFKRMIQHFRETRKSIGEDQKPKKAQKTDPGSVDLKSLGLDL